jgi:hypothetical protein
MRCIKENIYLFLLLKLQSRNNNRTHIVLVELNNLVTTHLIAQTKLSLVEHKQHILDYPGTSIKRGGLGGSEKRPNSNLQPHFQIGYVMEFGEHSTKQPHTKFQTEILMYGKAAALGSLLHTLQLIGQL